MFAAEKRGASSLSNSVSSTYIRLTEDRCSDASRLASIVVDLIGEEFWLEICSTPPTQKFEMKARLVGSHEERKDADQYGDIFDDSYLLVLWESDRR